MSQLSILIRRVGMAVLPLILVAGCASSRQEQAARAQLERAQAAYRQAQADPNVQAYAQLWLADAQKAVQAAEQAKTLEEKVSLGYVAEKRAQIATIAGATTKTEQDTLQLSRESSDVLLQKRDREVKAARAEAAAKAREAEQARAASEARARTTDTTAREVEQARLQAEAEARAYAAEQAKTAALAKELSDLKAQQTDRGLVLTVGDVLFAAGKADVAPGGQRSVDKLAEFLKKYPRRRVLIEGHSDNTGNEDFNLKRSRAALGARHRPRADHDPRLWAEIPDRGQRHARGAPAEPKGRGSGPERRGERREQFSISHSRPLRAPSR